MFKGLPDLCKLDELTSVACAFRMLPPTHVNVQIVRSEDSIEEHMHPLCRYGLVKPRGKYGEKSILHIDRLKLFICTSFSLWGRTPDLSSGCRASHIEVFFD